MCAGAHSGHCPVAQREFVDGEAIFNLEPTEALERLLAALDVCGSFKAAYFDTAQASAERVPDNPWKMSNSALFARLDLFIERCHDLHELALTGPLAACADATDTGCRVAMGRCPLLAHVAPSCLLSALYSPLSSLLPPACRARQPNAAPREGALCD